MAGKKGKSGRPRKPQLLQIAEGTHRSDRHGASGDAVCVDGKPEKPNFSNPWADELWETDIAPLIELGVITRTDSSIAQTTCEMYGLYRMCYELAEQDPTDKDTRIAVTAYWAKYEQGASRLGLNPSDRARMKVEKKKPNSIQGRKRG
ncbi:MAG: P27 family phage terminase small subunit [Planctomycetota bacterium]